MLESRLGVANEVLSALLGGHTKVFVTRCVINELKKLGESFSGTVLATRRLTTARCNHEMLKSAAECLEAMVGTDNPEHFFIATQDAGLRRKFRQVLGVPILLVQKNSLLLEAPSEYQHQVARMSEIERMHMNEREYKVLETREAKKKESVVDGDSAHDMSREELPKKIESEENSNCRRMLAVKDQPRLKRKKAKGPNPLSCKKKKIKVVNPSTTHNQGSQVEGTSGEKKRSRKRKRRHHKVVESGEAAGMRRNFHIVMCYLPSRTTNSMFEIYRLSFGVNGFVECSYSKRHSNV